MNCNPYLFFCDVIFFCFCVIIHFHNFAIFLVILSLFPSKYFLQSWLTIYRPSKRLSVRVLIVWLAITYLLCNWLSYSFFEFSTSYFIYLFNMSPINIYMHLLFYLVSLNFFYSANFRFANHDQQIENWLKLFVCRKSARRCWCEDLTVVWKTQQRKILYFRYFFVNIFSNFI